MSFSLIWAVDGPGMKVGGNVNVSLLEEYCHCYIELFVIV